MNKSNKNQKEEKKKKGTVNKIKSIFDFRIFQLPCQPSDKNVCDHEIRPVTGRQTAELALASAARLLILT